MFPDALTLIAPRHPDRGEAILRADCRASASSARCARGASGRGRETAIYICDTMGELGLFYRLAGVVLVGKSLAGGGGQNPIEPAKLASAILHGPHVANFADVYALLDGGGGASSRATPDELAATLCARSLPTPARLRAMARAAGQRGRAAGRRVERAMAGAATASGPLAASAT